MAPDEGLKHAVRSRTLGGMRKPTLSLSDFAPRVRPSALAGAGAACAMLLNIAVRADDPPRTILVCGDSMMKSVSRSLTREFAPVPGVKLAVLISIGTGLARPDVFDWTAEMKTALTSTPETVVAMLGANDGQNLRTAGGAVVLAGTPEWSVEYAGRISSLLQQMKEAGARHILWVGMPDMREAKLQADSRRINEITKAECARVEGVEFFDTAPLFSPKPGSYSAYVVREGCKPILVRSGDGAHLNVAGADILARALREKIAIRMSF